MNCTHAESISVFSRFWSSHVFSEYYAVYTVLKISPVCYPYQCLFAPSVQKGMGKISSNSTDFGLLIHRSMDSIDVAQYRKYYEKIPGEGKVSSFFGVKLLIIIGNILGPLVSDSEFSYNLKPLFGQMASCYDNQNMKLR